LEIGGGVSRTICLGWPQTIILPLTSPVDYKLLPSQFFNCSFQVAISILISQILSLTEECQVYEVNKQHKHHLDSKYLIVKTLPNLQPMVRISDQPDTVFCCAQTPFQSCPMLCSWDLPPLQDWTLKNVHSQA
jgi:hypothetical protein